MQKVCYITYINQNKEDLIMEMEKSNNELINYVIDGGRNADEAIKFVKTDFDKVLYNYAFKKKIDVEFSIEEEFEKLLNKYVPSNGKANTVIGEIIRGCNKLMYRWINDGDEIECGPYSGILYGLQYDLESPFVPQNNACNWDYEYDAIGMYWGCINKNIVINICLNCLILETFDYYHRKNYTDIGNYYDNIVNFIIDEKIIEKFKEHDIDITHNMGSYGSHFREEIDHINSISEDLYIYFDYNTIKVDYTSSMNAQFKLEFDRNEIDTILNMYGELLKYIIHRATYDWKKYLMIDELKSELNKIGFTVNSEKYITKLAA